jgi:hypothetical protein
MPIGGARKGAGRPKASKTKLIEQSKSRTIADETGLLPHEWLLKISRGEPVTHVRWVVKHDVAGNERSRILVTEQIYADFPTRIDAAKAIAPFYAPKLTSTKTQIEGTTVIFNDNFGMKTAANGN